MSRKKALEHTRMTLKSLLPLKVRSCFPVPFPRSRPDSRPLRLSRLGNGTSILVTLWQMHDSDGITPAQSKGGLFLSPDLDPSPREYFARIHALSAVSGVSSDRTIRWQAMFC